MHDGRYKVPRFGRSIEEYFQFLVLIKYKEVWKQKNTNMVKPTVPGKIKKNHVLIKRQLSWYVGDIKMGRQTR